MTRHPAKRLSAAIVVKLAIGSRAADKLGQDFNLPLSDWQVENLPH
jgi:hypothetical protein